MAYKQEKLLWVDMEMTGLDPNEDRVTEVAAIVADRDFNEIDTYESMVFQPQEVLDRMKDAPFFKWSSGDKKKIGTVYEMAEKSGMLDSIKDAPKEDKVEQELADFIKKHFDKPAVLAGNSIHQDRRFIRQWWPKVEELLHYRIVDVSSFKIMFETEFDWTFRKQEKHRALDDIRESMGELQFYLDKIRHQQQ